MIHIVCVFAGSDEQINEVNATIESTPEHFRVAKNVWLVQTSTHHADLHWHISGNMSRLHDFRLAVFCWDGRYATGGGGQYTTTGGDKSEELIQWHASATIRQPLPLVLSKIGPRQ